MEELFDVFDRKGNYIGIKTKLLFSTYHNKHFTDEELASKGVKRVDFWQEICEILIKSKKGQK